MVDATSNAAVARRVVGEVAAVVAAEVGLVHRVPAGAAGRTFSCRVFSSSSSHDVGCFGVQSDLSLQRIFIFCSSIGGTCADVLVQKLPA